MTNPAEFEKRLNAMAGQEYPADFTYTAAPDADGTIELALADKGAGNDAKFWQRPDTWGLAILADLEEFLGATTPKPALRLKLSVRDPESDRTYHEALLRRVSYLAAVNRDIGMVMFTGGTPNTLYSPDELAKRSDREVIRKDGYTNRGDADAAGRLEKDFQVYLFGKGLYGGDKPKRTAAIRINERLALLGPDFAEGDRKKHYGMDREFPASAFDLKISEKTRILPAWYIDLLTMNKKDELSVIELKFHNAANRPALEVAGQVLDYALFFHSYREALVPVIKQRIGCDAGKAATVTYLVSNLFHPRLERIWPRYSRGALKLRRIVMGYMPE